MLPNKRPASPSPLCLPHGRPSNRNRSHRPTGIWRAVQITRILIMHFPTISRSLLTRTLQNLPQHPLPEHHQPMFLPSRGRPKLTPRQIDRKNNANRSVYFIRCVLHSERKNNRFWSNGSRHSPDFHTPLISSCVLFWFVSVVSKYMSFPTLSKNLWPTFMFWFCLRLCSRYMNIHLTSSALLLDQAPY
jgi:hypothetical protein